MQPAMPAVLLDAIGGWPAMGCRRWTLEYLLDVAGHRTVPVEVGPHYLSDEFDERLMSLRDFIETFIFAPRKAEGGAMGGVRKAARTDSAGRAASTPAEDALETEVEGLAAAVGPADRSGARGYLAQHALFEQLPQLRRDIQVPDYCALSLEGAAGDEEEGTGDEVGDSGRQAAAGLATRQGGRSNALMDAPRINAWLGPAGTVSPLHHDRYHNLLAQVPPALHPEPQHPEATSLSHTRTPAPAPLPPRSHVPTVAPWPSPPKSPTRNLGASCSPAEAAGGKPKQLSLSLSLRDPFRRWSAPSTFGSTRPTSRSDSTRTRAGHTP
jgi:lysine-specific demethylase 8